jgi:hypothetical protein
MLKLRRFSRGEKGSALKDFLSASLGFITSVSLVLLFVWGIGWSFYRHGAFDGFLSLIFPPYALYRGAAFFWEEPAWKEKYDLRTEELAMLIAYSTTQDPVYQLESRKYVDRVKRWLENVPEAEKRKLMNASSKFSESVELYLENLLFNIVNKSDKDPVSDPRIKSNEVVFMKIEGFSNVWNSIQKEANILEKFTTENNISQNVISENNKALFISKANALTASARNKMKETIDSIFDQ